VSILDWSADILVRLRGPADTEAALQRNPDPRWNANFLIAHLDPERDF
jgi:hypothetical protein